jgi:BioD-like phosphotransacetylase family protein
MSFIFTAATGDHAGHSLITWAIARRLLERGKSVGFVKPFGTHPINKEGLWTDRDALLFKEVLNLQEPMEHICPYLLSEETWCQRGTGEILEEIKSLAQEISAEKDVLLVMGSEHIFFDDSSRPIPDVALINELKADLVLISRFRDTAKSIYSILSISSLLKDRVKGIILNRVAPEKLEEISNQMIPSLAQKGVPIIAALPEDPVLSFRSLREIRDILNAETLWGEEGLELSVGGMTVGSTDLRGGLLLFKRAYNKIIFLEPSPLDAETEDAETRRPIAGILLTGGRSPAPQLLEAAKNAKTPLMLVKDDTFAVLERLEKTATGLASKDEFKVRHFTELMDHDGALDRLLQSFDITQ